MLRTLLDATSLALARLKRHRRLQLAGPCIKVNLGSALAVAPGWVNLDASLNALVAGAPSWLLGILYRWSGSRVFFSREEYLRILRSNQFVHHNFKYALPLEDSSVDYIFSSHLLEHLFRDEAGQFLRECYRVLKPGGSARICVPDLHHALVLFSKGEKLKALEFFFVDSHTGRFNRHQYMYDFELLSAALHEAGFVGVTRCTFRQGRVPDLRILDNRPEETLYVEAQKPIQTGT